MCSPGSAAQASASLLNLVGASPSALAALFSSAGAPSYRATQVLRAVHRSPRAESLAGLTQLGLAERAALANSARIDRGSLASEQRSADGTIKWLVALPEPHARLKVETVFISPPTTGADDDDDHYDDGGLDEADGSGFSENGLSRRGGGGRRHVQNLPRLRRGGTLCVSSQAGCSLSCTFCRTGTQRLESQLDAAGIVGQVHLATDRLAALGSGDHIRNVVFMGMGEPLLNPRAVFAAVQLLVAGVGLAPRRITISTAGVTPALARAAEELPPGVRLAVSLHAPDDALRTRLMPSNATYGGVDALLNACRIFAAARGDGAPSRSTSRAAGRITFEYALLAGVNDSPEQARSLAALLSRHLPPHAAHINLLPFHEWPGAPYSPSARPAILAFQAALAAAGMRAHIRTSRGIDILAACGQLRSAHAAAKEAARVRA